MRAAAEDEAEVAKAETDIQGERGTDGTNGVDGVDGTDGQDGAKGERGTDGAKGFADVLKGHPVVRLLDLGGCDVGDVVVTD